MLKSVIQPLRESASVLRPLGSLEEFFWLIDQDIPTHFVVAAEIEGRTTVAGWREALDLVQRRHPFFSAYIEANTDSAPYFRRATASPIPMRVVQGNNAAESWDLEIERELSAPFSTERAPLVRAVLLHEVGRAVYMLTVHHSIADALSLTFVIHDTLQVLAGKPIGLLRLPPSHEAILGLTGKRAGRPGFPNQSNSARSATAATSWRKANLHPRVRSLCLPPIFNR
jgi:condensation domain-containing protein